MGEINPKKYIVKMGVLTVEREMPTAVAQATIFKVFVLEADKLIPKIIPQISVELLEGNGGPGTIRKTTFASQDSEFKYVKSKVEATDKDNFTHCYRIIGGEPWNDTLEKITIEIKISANPDGGSILKSTTKYFPKKDCEVDEDTIRTKADKALDMFKAIEAYVLANPDACN